MKDKIRKMLGLLTGFSVKSLALIAFYLYLVAGEYVLAYFSIFVAWGGYLMAHYIVTGEIIDDRVGEKELRNGERFRVLAGGGLLFGIGMTMMIYFLSDPVNAGVVKLTDIIGSYLGLMSVFAGYVVIHYENSGSLL